MEMLQETDKENMSLIYKSGMELSSTPNRTPLRSMNMSKQINDVRSCYSPLTPLMMKTPLSQRKSFKMRAALPIYCDSLTENPGQVLQKKLVRKQVNDSIKHVKEKYESQLSEKDLIIKNLQNQLAAAESKDSQSPSSITPHAPCAGVPINSVDQSVSSITSISSTLNSIAKDIHISKSDLDCDRALQSETGMADGSEPSINKRESSVSKESNQNIISDKKDENVCSLPPEAELDEFVSDVLNRCVQSLVTEQTKDDLMPSYSSNVRPTATSNIPFASSTQLLSSPNNLGRIVDHDYCAPDGGRGDTSDLGGRKVDGVMSKDIAGFDREVTADRVNGGSAGLCSYISNGAMTGNIFNLERELTTEGIYKEVDGVCISSVEEVLTCSLQEHQRVTDTKSEPLSHTCEPDKNTEREDEVEKCTSLVENIEAEISTEQIHHSDTGCSIKLLSSGVDTSCTACNTSIQYCTETTSSAVTSCELGTMAGSGTQDANTSMVQIKLTDTSCSPMKPDMANQSIMAVTGSADANTSMVSVQLTDSYCSPVKPATADQSIMIKADIADADTSMMLVETIDVETMARPVTEEKATMTDSTVLLKLSHKSGQPVRTSLQDIRSQHPTVIANHIDSLNQEIHRLRKEIGELKSGETTGSAPQKPAGKVIASKLPVTKSRRLQSVSAREKKPHTEEARYKHQLADLMKKCSDLERELRTAKQPTAKQAQKEKNEEKEMKRTLTALHDSNIKMEELYESTSTDILKATGQLQTQLADIHKDIQEVENGKVALLARISEMEENDKAAYLEIQTLNAALKTQETYLQELSKTQSLSENQHQQDLEQIKHLQEENQGLSEKEKTQNSTISYLQGKITDYELTMKNLQRTVDFHEEDIDKLEKELFNFREGYVDQESELEKISSENMELRECSAVMLGKFQELQASYTQLLQKTESMKTSSALAVKTKSQEITKARCKLDDLSEKMNNVLHNLRERVQVATRDVAKTTDTEEESPIGVERQQQSLVSQVLGAVETQQCYLSEAIASPGVQSEDSTGELQSPAVVNNAIDNSGGKTFVSCFKNHEKKNVTLPSTDNDTPSCSEPIDLSVFSKACSTSSDDTCLRSVGESRLSSAFTAVRESAFQPKCGRLNSAPQILQSETLKDKCSVQVKNNVDTLATSENSDDNATDLADYVLSIKELFLEIIRVANMFETASQLSIGDLKEENENLMTQLDDLERRECYLKAELKMKKQELKESCEQVGKLEESLQRMTDSLMQYNNQESTIKSLNLEVTSLRKKVDLIEADKQILEKHLKDVTSNRGVSNMDDAHLRAQILSLTRKCRKLQEKLIHQQEYFEDLETKAASRMELLKENWKKAESEVYRFDELVEKIREVLEKNAVYLDANTELKELLLLIDGQSDVNSASDPLQPIKTAAF